jgi:hypothetical protein
MRLPAVLIAAATFAWTACSAVDAAPPREMATGKPFTLQVGHTARLASESLLVGFDGVSADSRCPEGAQCVWAGDVTARVWWQRGGGARQSGELHLSPRTAKPLQMGGLQLTLVAMDPAPVSDKAVDKSAYVATLLLSSGAATEADR